LDPPDELQPPLVCIATTVSVFSSMTGPPELPPCIALHCMQQHTNEEGWEGKNDDEE
jgi:hypothetical protein